MNKNIKVDENRLFIIAQSCWSILEQCDCKDEALKNISRSVKVELGEYFNPGILAQPDEISINFIELIDQIVFEMEKQYPEDDSIREYVIDDLYQRLTIYLEVFINLETYKKNLNRRIPTKDDTVIIKHFHLDEYIDELINSFDELQNLQKEILLTLLSFNNENLLHFYYKVVKGMYCFETRCLALLGLKRCGMRFQNWHKLDSSNNDELIPVISYIQKIDSCEIWNNNIPDNYIHLSLLIFFSEIYFDKIISPYFTTWIFKLLHAVVSHSNNITISPAMYYAISSILIKINLDFYSSIINNDELLTAYIEIIDILPRNYFDRVTVKLDMTGKAFVERVHELTALDLISQKDIESNTQTYLFWKSSQNFSN